MTDTMTIELVHETCCNCHMPYAFSREFYNARKADGGLFHCPNGHRQHYTETTESRLRKELETAKSNANYYQGRASQEATEARRARTQLRATKTRMNNLKTRIANGVCPCCNRQFQNLHRHISHMHPTYKAPDATNGAS